MSLFRVILCGFSDYAVSAVVVSFASRAGVAVGAGGVSWAMDSSER